MGHHAAGDMCLKYPQNFFEQLILETVSKKY